MLVLIYQNYDINEKGNINMSYSVAVTSAGQMTIPKALRDVLGISDRVRVDKRGDEIIVKREKTREEQLRESFDRMDSLWTDEERARIKENAGLTYKQTIEDLEKTPEGRREIEAEYGEGIYGY